MWHRANVANGRNGILGAKNVLASRTIGEQWNLCVVFFFPRIDPAGRLICTVRPDVSSEKQTSPERKKEWLMEATHTVLITDLIRTVIHISWREIAQKWPD